MLHFLRRNTGAGHQTRRPRTWRFWAVLALVGALLAGPALSSADDDVGVLAGMLQSLLSDAGRDVRIRGFEGALSSRATVAEISIADTQGVWLVLSDVVIDWNRGALLDRRVDVNEMSAGRINLLRLPSSQPTSSLPSATASEEFSLPELPVSVFLGDIRADLVVVDAAVLGEAAELTLHGAMQLEGGQGTASFEAERTDGQAGSFHFIGEFNNTSRNLSLDLRLSEGPGGVVATLLGIPAHPAMALEVAGNGPISTFVADISLATDGQQRVRGEFALVDTSPETGVLQGGGFALDIEGDLRPLLVADLHPFFGARSTLHAVGERSDSGEINLPELTITTNAARMQGRAAFGADGLPVLVQLTAGIERGDGETVLLPGTGGSARIASASLSIAFDAARSRDWRIRADIAALSLPDITVDTAALVASGRLNSLTSGASESEPPFEGVFDFAAQGIEATDPALQQAIGTEVYGLASLVWPGPEQPLELTGFAIEGQTVSLTAYGQIDGLRFDGYSEFEVPDLGAFSALAGRPLGGSILSTLRGRVNPLTGALDIEVDLTAQDLSVNMPEADALLAGQSGISLSVLRNTEGTQLRGFDLIAGTVELGAEGQLRPEDLRLTTRLTASDLSPLGAGYGGRLAIEAEVTAAGDARRLRLDGTASDLRLGSLPGAEILAGLFVGATRLRGDVQQSAERIDIALFTLEGPQVALNATGQWSETPDVALNLLRLEMAGLAAGGTGALSGTLHLTGDAQATEVTLAVSGPAPLRSGIAALDGVIGNGLRLDASAVQTAAGRSEIRAVRLQAQGLEATMAGWQDPDGAAQLTLTGGLENVGQMVPGLSGPAAIDARIGRRAGNDGYALAASLTGPSDLSISADGRVNDDFSLALALRGQVRAALANASLEPASVSGLIRFDGAVTGPATLDSLHLNASIDGARYALPGVGVAFENVAGTAQLNGLSAQVSVQGESLSGGRAWVDGTIRLDNQRQAALRLRVEDLGISQPRLFDARVSGEARLTGPLTAGALVQGEVTVNGGEISIPNSPLGRQGFVPEGLRHVGEDAASRATRTNAGIAIGARYGSEPVPLRLDLTVNAPGRVYIRGRGLDAELGGVLRLGGTTHDVIPSGSFGLIRGRLDLLGNRFTLTDGSASMIGSFMPYVSLTATTESDGVLTSVTLSGQASSPQIVFSSVPELPQDEVLARLIFRRSLSSLSVFQAAQLALSVATLTGAADNSILSRSRQAMGLDDLDFTTDEAGNTALRAGRYVTERVYTDLSVDSAGRGEVSINLDLTPDVTLRGRVDTAGSSGVGLFYERDY